MCVWFSLFPRRKCRYETALLCCCICVRLRVPRHNDAAIPPIQNPVLGLSGSHHVVPQQIQSRSVDAVWMWKSMGRSVVIYDGLFIDPVNDKSTKEQQLLRRLTYINGRSVTADVKQKRNLLWESWLLLHHANDDCLKNHFSAIE